MAVATLTAANTVFTLVVVDIFPAPVPIQGYAMDDVFSFEAVESIEIQMGVDGQLSGGWLPTPKKMTITLQADSPSIIIFDTWQQFQEANRDAFIADGILIYPGLKRVFTLTKGFMSSTTLLPDVRKILQPRKFQITWENILGAPI
jgi:hypothetical protein